MSIFSTIKPKYYAAKVYKKFSNSAIIDNTYQFSNDDKRQSILSNIDNNPVTKPTSKWLYKTHIAIQEQTKNWDLNKQSESIESAWSALKSQQELYTHKKDKLSESEFKSKLSALNYFSKEHKLGRKINSDSTKMFFPLETTKGKWKRRACEGLRNAYNTLDIIPRMIFTGLVPMPPVASSAVNGVLLAFGDPLFQKLADHLQDVCPGAFVSKTSNTKIKNYALSNAKLLRGHKENMEAVSGLYDILESTIEKCIEKNIDPDQVEINFSGEQISLNKLYEQTKEDLINLYPKSDEHIKSYKGDTHYRKFKTLENLGQSFIRAGWAVTVKPVSLAVNAISGGVIPRGDKLIRAIVQPIAAFIDGIPSQSYIRGRHFKDPGEIFTQDAIDADFHNIAPYMENEEMQKIAFLHVAKSNTEFSIQLKNSFPEINWSNKDLIEEMQTNKDIVEQVAKLFLFSTDKIQTQINHYPEARIGCIQQNLMHKIAKLQREHSKLYRQFDAINSDIKEYGSLSKYYNEKNAKKNKVYSHQEILHKLNQNKLDQKSAIKKYELLEQATRYAQRHKGGNISIDESWANSLDKLYYLEKEEEAGNKKSILKTAKDKLLYNPSVLGQLKHNRNVIITGLKNTLFRSPSSWLNESIFRQNQFPIFAIDNTLATLDKMGDNLSAVDKTYFHDSIASFVANGAFFAPQVIMSMWQYQENMARFGRPKHHEFYTKVMLEKSQVIIAQNNLEQARILVKLEKLKTSPNPKKEESLKAKLECVNFILQNLPKAMHSLELSIGKPEHILNCLANNSKNNSEERKIDVANALASMASGLIAKDYEEPPENFIQEKRNGLYKFLDNAKLGFRKDANIENKKAIDISRKLFPKVKTGGISPHRAWYTIKTTILPHGDLKYYKQFNEELTPEKDFFANTFFIYNASNIQDKNINDICQEILNKIPVSRVIDKMLFISKIRELYNSIKNYDNNLLNKLSKNLNGISVDITKENINSFVIGLEEFLSNVDRDVENNGFKGLINDKLAIDLGNGQSVTLDLSQSGHYTHALERDLYLDVDAMNSKKSFALSWGKISNLNKRILVPIGQFVIEKLPRYIVTTPFTVARAIFDMEVASLAAKNSRTTMQAIHEKHFLDKKDVGGQAVSGLGSQFIQKYEQQLEALTKTKHKATRQQSEYQKKIDYISGITPKFDVKNTQSNYKYNLINEKQRDLENLKAKINSIDIDKAALDADMQNILNQITKLSLRKEHNHAPRYKAQVAKKIQKMNDEQPKSAKTGSICSTNALNFNSLCNLLLSM